MVNMFINLQLKCAQIITDDIWNGINRTLLYNDAFITWKITVSFGSSVIILSSRSMFSLLRNLVICTLTFPPLIISLSAHYLVVIISEFRKDTRLYLSCVEKISAKERTRIACSRLTRSFLRSTVSSTFRLLMTSTRDYDRLWNFRC